MKKIVNSVVLFSVFSLVISLVNYESFSATACTAKADNGATCSVNCASDQIAFCAAGARTVICECRDLNPEPAPKGNFAHAFKPFAPGEREYLGNQLKSFILSLNSERATALANALDQVIAAVDQNNPDLYNEAEWNYHDRRLELTDAERQALDDWVARNAFYH